MCNLTKKGLLFCKNCLEMKRRFFQLYDTQQNNQSEWKQWKHVSSEYYNWFAILRNDLIWYLVIINCAHCIYNTILFVIHLHYYLAIISYHFVLESSVQTRRMQTCLIRTWWHIFIYHLCMKFMKRRGSNVLSSYRIEVLFSY
jgi:hypothetical protein